MTDDVSTILDTVSTALKQAFTGGSSQPPLGGGTEDVRLLAGDTLPLAVWNAHVDGGCGEPLVWVRLARRFRSRALPQVATEPTPCALPKAVEIEVGVARCAVVEADTDWQALAEEAEVSLDDSWRIEVALCRAVDMLADTTTQTTTGDIVPFGPEGGIIAWSGTLWAQH